MISGVDKREEIRLLMVVADSFINTCRDNPKFNMTTESALELYCQKLRSGFVKIANPSWYNFYLESFKQHIVAGKKTVDWLAQHLRAYNIIHTDIKTNSNLA